MERRLYKSKRNSVFSGVCGGIAEYFAIDPVIIRIAWVAVGLTLGAGILGVIAYVIAAMIIPERPGGFSNLDGQQDSYDGFNQENSDYNGNWSGGSRFDAEKGRIILGGGLVILGVLFFARQFLHINLEFIWPLILIAIGAFVIYKGRGGKA